MRIQIRKGVFETNSSSEHTISIVKKSDFDKWKNGELYAQRLTKVTEYEKTWGNFWSEQNYWSFMKLKKEDVDAINAEILGKHIARRIDELKHYAERDKRETAKQYVEEEIAKESSKTYETIGNVDKLYLHMWITYEEYMDALRNDDCYSPFEHTDKINNVVVFGKYFHS